MTQPSAARILSEAAIKGLIAASADNPLGLASLAATMLGRGDQVRATALARRAIMLAPGDGDVVTLARRVLSRKVPSWHFGIVQDEARNRAYDAALRRAVGPDSRVLDIGAGTGLLAMMAARAGAGAVVSCEMSPPVADAATEIVALNGYADRVRVVAKKSTDLTPDDVGGRVDVIVSEIVSNELLMEGPLPAMADAVPRLLKPGGRVIPSHGAIRVALAWHPRARSRRMDTIEGFDMTPFNRLAATSRRLKVGDPELALRSAPATLFDFDFASGGPYRDEKAGVALTATGGSINGIVQWIWLRLDAEGTYENQPEPGATSCWAALFTAFDADIDPAPGTVIQVHGAHRVTHVRIWADV
jgi:type II protein arginine methyltransferase